MESKSPVPDGGGGGGNGLPPKPSRRDGAAPPESDMSHMPESPRRAMGHRRAHSETSGGLPDDLDLGVPGGGGGGEGRASLSDENEEELFSMFLDAEKLNASEAESSSCAPAGVGARPRHHQHSHSMDASSSFDAEQLLGAAAAAAEGMSTAEAKKAMSNAKLAELALVDPKKAKRIWANRQSAARSKERKMRYISELERKVQTLHAEATTLSTQLALLHRDTAGLSTENSELKMRLQNVEQQVHLQDALNDALKSELQRLRMATGQMGSNIGGMMNFMGPPPPQPFGGNQTMFHIQSQTAMQPLHHMQIHPHHQQQQQQALLHPLQLRAQQLLPGQQHAAAPPNPKMKRTISAPNQWVGGWSESGSN